VAPWLGSGSAKLNGTAKDSLFSADALKSLSTENNIIDRSITVLSEGAFCGLGFRSPHSRALV
jgi:hypothetical protein